MPILNDIAIVIEAMEAAEIEGNLKPVLAKDWLRGIGNQVKLSVRVDEFISASTDSTVITMSIATEIPGLLGAQNEKVRHIKSMFQRIKERAANID